MSTFVAALFIGARPDHRRIVFFTNGLSLVLLALILFGGRLIAGFPASTTQFARDEIFYRYLSAGSATTTVAPWTT